MMRRLPTVAMAAVLALATAAPASADRVNDVANDIGGAVCVIVGADPTFHGINSIGQALNQRAGSPTRPPDGSSPSQCPPTARGTSHSSTCTPRHLAGGQREP
ncbi:Uncharacterised protein [Mycobacteroides abscessus subsp. abscessus]|uniref:hypothetical protein n=1 Tax=Mycobacteroides abscessus TaxID=36809 RepID=UPI0009275712|nr:hypothetical protein [Mycobacteroides abscessus]SIG30265.1 Uncharacterised protein [Mycobacteroides abscessus subsp. abscessus]SIH55411.1 Uncharacterised protein [Mycobacteroides abscessus subsp. abscessus]SIM80294.1 Uncharacterised protein [Mycobacteroides abscessus subsp. abscessus]